jgi:demethylmenaquinone methyltransferase/2-methoxy-6-polyprenyl-1,4-benzoquinol methylase
MFFKPTLSGILEAMSKTTGSYVKKAIKSPDRVQSMFDGAAKRYDLLNRLMTMGMDQRWRKIAAKSTAAGKGSLVLDACTGTGDLALAVSSITGSRVVGVDFSQDMLDLAEEKISKAGLADEITFAAASVDDLPFEDNKFDAITIGFGLRNTPDYRAVLREFYRVTRPGGRLVILESSQPERKILVKPYKLFVSSVVPFTGRLFAGDYQAYKYLSDSMQVFPPQKELASMMGEAGWTEVAYRNFFLGATAIHVGTK